MDQNCNCANPKGTAKNHPMVTIAVEGVLRQRLGQRRMRWIPGFLIRGLERFIRQERLNQLLHNSYPHRGCRFCESVLKEMNVTYDVVHPERLPEPGADSRVIFVSNHPLGGLDGLILSDMIGHACATEDIRFVVNDLLAAVEPLTDIFVPVNKHGRQGREAVSRLEQSFEGDAPVVMFPAGLVSRLGDDGTIRDLEWQKMFVNRAIKSRRDIVVLRFIGENSSFFYKFARARKTLGIGFNVEMTRLPAELVRAEGSHFRIVVGERIAWQTLRGGTEAVSQAEAIRRMVYELDDSK
ncbi:MAG: 1-acyl-sn-glycerol-3-phosphate acyltransferase [Clostridium sp.]|nr:1-acyl-sn-glycerol-3-phosphate acyltransferase [Clostridium sp.]